MSVESPKVLVTGAQGVIGSFLVRQLRELYGKENVIAGGRRQPKHPSEEPFAFCDVTNFVQLDDVVEKHKINWLFHMAAMLSMGCEADPLQGMKVNMQGFQNVMEVARKHNLRVVTASTIGTFGPSAPTTNTPDVTILRPLTLYGCTKVHNELIGEYYQRKFGVDFRCMRLPVVLAKGGSDPVKSVVGFATKLFEDAAKNRHGSSDVAEHTRLSYVYIDDCIDGLVKLMQVENDKLSQRTYNVQGDSFSAGQIVAEIQKQVPTFTVDYSVNEMKQRILDATGDSVDDSNARKDWKWQPKYDLHRIVHTMMNLSSNNFY